MKPQLSLHLTAFNNKIKVMNQSGSKEMVLSAVEARNIHSDIFDLLNKLNELIETKKTTPTDAVVSVELKGGSF
jgi:hypothetical protein